MIGSKNVFGSLTIWGSIAMFVSGVWGFELNPDEAQELGNQASEFVRVFAYNAEALALMLGSLITAFGRIRATKVLNATPKP